MELYTKVEIQGEIKKIYDLKHGNKASYISGAISTYDIGTKGKYNFFNLYFIGFDKVAEDIDELRLEEGDIVLLRGSLKENNYNNKKTIQLIVSSVLGVDNTTNHIEKRKQENIETNTNKNPYKVNDEFEDDPFG